MKISTSDKGTLEFHGKCKDARIRKANLITGDVDRLIHRVIASRGIYDSDSRNIKRYARAIESARDTKEKVKVTEA